MILLGSDSNRWVSVILALLILSFLVSCQDAQSQKAVASLRDELQIDGYGHIEDTYRVDVSQRPMTCEDLKSDLQDLTCPDGIVKFCHVPQDNPLSAHVLFLDKTQLKERGFNAGEFPMPCFEEFVPGQNCPFLDCEHDYQEDERQARRKKRKHHDHHYDHEKDHDHEKEEDDEDEA